MPNFDFLEFFNRCSNEELYNFLLEKNLIYQSVRCSFCFEEKVIKTTKDNYFGYNFRCMNTICNKYQTTTSIFKDSFFDKSKVHIKLFLRALFYISTGVCSSDIMQFTLLKKTFFKKIKSKIINKMEIFYQQNPVRLGGLNVTVNVDETKLTTM